MQFRGFLGLFVPAVFAMSVYGCSSAGGNYNGTLFGSSGISKQNAGDKTARSNERIKPLKRLAPVVPKALLKGDYSGYCIVKFDVSPQGSTFNVEVDNCTHEILKQRTINTIKTWTYIPAVENGEAVVVAGLHHRVSFDVFDERGRKLPFPPDVK